ncbi:MAG TPA: serine hydrolase [Gemmatimonadaceae bacterium]|nr:serine hydrolase [Gemmatimonadaceae bacterium]
MRLLVRSTRNRRATHAATIVLVAAMLSPSSRAQAQAARDSTVHEILRQRVATGVVPGLVAGWIDSAGGAHVVSAGASGKAGVPLDGASVFEIGSITKTFTTTLLADMVLRGEVALDDPVQRFLPDSVHVPSRGGRQITLLDLATQSSGLPRMPTNFKPADPSNPYADYSVAQMYAFLSSYTLPRDPGAQYEYSNLGMGLLGHALALRAGTSYEALLVERVLEPLGMHDTRITLTPSMRSRMVAGHDADGTVVPPWDLPTLAGAGALRSTVQDMLIWMRAQRDTSHGPLAAAIALTQHRHRDGPDARTSMGLGWHLIAAGDHAIVFHNGGTGGFHSFMALDPATGTNAVMFGNSSANIDDIGFHLVVPTAPLQPPAPPRATVSVAPEILEQYVGTYEMNPQFSITISRRDSALFAQATGQPEFRLFAASESEFFLKVVEASVTFERDAAGTVTGLVLHQGGAHQRARKLR